MHQGRPVSVPGGQPPAQAYNPVPPMAQLQPPASMHDDPRFQEILARKRDEVRQQYEAQQRAQ